MDLNTCRCLCTPLVHLLVTERTGGMTVKHPEPDPAMAQCEERENLFFKRQKRVREE